MIESKSTKNLNEQIPYGLPLNTYYITWGSKTEIISSNTTKISDLYIDSNNNNINRYIEVTYLSKIDREIKVYSSDTGFYYNNIQREKL